MPSKKYMETKNIDLIHKIGSSVANYILPVAIDTARTISF
jgi:hypothetical protein